MATIVQPSELIFPGEAKPLKTSMDLSRLPGHVFGCGHRAEDRVLDCPQCQAVIKLRSLTEGDKDFEPSRFCHQPALEVPKARTDSHSTAECNPEPPLSPLQVSQAPTIAVADEYDQEPPLSHLQDSQQPTVAVADEYWDEHWKQSSPAESPPATQGSDAWNTTPTWTPRRRLWAHQNETESR